MSTTATDTERPASSLSSNGSIQRIKHRAMLLSFVVGMVLLAMKLFAWTLTGSTAILSDALESIINVVASGFALFSVWLSSQPADQNHPYGHGKIEYFSAGFEGGLIALAAVAILWSAIPRLWAPVQLEELGLGALVVAVATAANLGLGLMLVSRGRRVKSLALVADGRHLLTDVYTSVGVVLGLGLVKMTGWTWLDPAVAILLALNILVAGWRLVRTAADRLLDAADPELLNAAVEVLNEARKPGWNEPHQLRATHAGSRVNADLHVFMPRFWDLKRVHMDVEDLERRLLQRFGGECEATIHVDPCKPRHCVECALQDCALREAAFEGERPWTTEAVQSRGAHPRWGT